MEISPGSCRNVIINLEFLMVPFVNKISSGLLYDGSMTIFPTAVFGLVNETKKFNRSSSTHFGFISKGSAKLTVKNSSYKLIENMFFCCSSRFSLKAEHALVIERLEYQGCFQIGGPVEKVGRLEYIDGCKSSLLVFPNRLGDPCLNLLTFPPNTKQSQHTHPTIRTGIINYGSGVCLIGKKEIPLKKDDVFYLPANQSHSFHSGPRGLSVIAYHPDTDWGPTDQRHPMLNRTFLNKK